MNQPKSEAAGPGILGGSCREKYWSELTDAEKIERLHQVVKQLMGDVKRTSRVADAARRTSEAHQHATSGEVLVPARSDAGNEACSRPNYNEQYF